MTSKIVSEPGYYNGKFLKAGMSYDDQGVSEGGKDVPHQVDLGAMTKEELVKEAKARGLEIDASKTKAEIISTIEAASST